MYRRRSRPVLAPLTLALVVLGLAPAGATTTLAATPHAHATAAARHAPHRAQHPRHRHRHHHAVVAATGAGPAPAGEPTPPAAPASAPAPAAASAGTCADADLAPASENLDRVRTAILCLVNQQRAASGLAPLRRSAGLDAAAQAHAGDMVARNYFDHVGPTGVGVLDRVLAAGYATAQSILDVAENIAAASGSLATPAATLAGWMSSPGHRANILAAGVSDTGIGVVAAAPALLGAGGAAGATYAEYFAARQ